MIHVRPLAAAAAALTLSMASHIAAAAEPGEPQIASYALDIEAKVLSDRRTNGLSDTYLSPGAELTFNVAHESGMVGFLQLGNVAKESFPDGGTTAVGAIGYRWGNPSGWHFGVGGVLEAFPRAKVKDAPRNPLESADTVNTRFDTTFGIFEFGYGIIEGRYLLVTSKDFRGNNTSVVCGSAAMTAMAEGDATLSKAMDCYGRGTHHSRGSQLIQLEARIPVASNTKVLTHIGYTAVNNFSFLNTVDYKFGVIHNRWGFEFEADVVGGLMRDSYYAKTVNEDGDVKRIDRMGLILSVAKRF